MSELLHGPGFLGTDAQFMSDLALVLMVLSAALFTIGRHLARTGRYEVHRWVQTAGVVLTTIVAIGFMVSSFTTHILPGVPSKLLEGDYGVSTLHSVVGTLAVLLGVFVVLRGHDLLPQALRFKDYKPVMRLTYVMYIIATLLGLTVYILVFVFGI